MALKCVHCEKAINNVSEMTKFKKYKCTSCEKKFYVIVPPKYYFEHIELFVAGR